MKKKLISLIVSICLIFTILYFSPIYGFSYDNLGEVRSIPENYSFTYTYNAGNPSVCISVGSDSSDTAYFFVDLINKKISILKTETNPYSGDVCSSSGVPGYTTDIMYDHYSENLNGEFVVETNEFYETPTPPVDPKPVSTLNFVHTHDFVEGEIYSATTTTDGLGGVYCKSCGAIQSSYPISAYGYSINDYATPMVNASKSGQTTTFEFDEWNSFPKAFMEKIAAKSAEGVSFVFHYKWNHVKKEIIIPAGTTVDLNFDWYGPAKMDELYGMN